MDGYRFTSSIFQSGPKADRGPNPQANGRQLALWLKTQLEHRGYAIADLFAEDWGWCVMCQSNPFKLWVGCGAVDAVDDGPGYGVSTEESTVWHCFPVAEAPLLARVFGGIATEPALGRLDADLHEILASDPDIRLVDIER